MMLLGKKHSFLLFKNGVKEEILLIILASNIRLIGD
jgi:hypothetical protein